MVCQAVGIGARGPCTNRSGFSNTLLSQGLHIWVQAEEDDKIGKAKKKTIDKKKGGREFTGITAGIVREEC